MNNDGSEFNPNLETKALIRIYTESLVQKLIEKGILRTEENPQGERSFLYARQRSDSELETTTLPSYDFRLIDLKKLIWELLRNSEINSQEIISSLTNLEYKELLKISEITTQLIVTIIEKAEIVEDNELLDVLSDIVGQKLDLNKIYLEVLKCFSFFLIKQQFINYDFRHETRRNNKTFDFTLKPSDNTQPNIFIEIKYWGRHIGRLEDLINQNIRYLESFTSLKLESNPIAVVIIFTNEKVKKDIEEKINRILPSSDKLAQRLRFVIIPLNNIQIFKIELLHLYELLLVEISILERTLTESPVIIGKKEKYQIDSQILKNEKGSISVWVKVPQLQDLLSSTVNNRYIISHDTNLGHTKNKKYLNAFALSLHPDLYPDPNQHKNPTKVNWRLWISNKSGDYLDIDFEGEFGEPAWNFFTIRWDHSYPKLEILLNSVLVIKKGDYHNCWPEEFSDKIFVGNWVSLDDVHNFGMPIFNLVVYNRCINDLVIKNEWGKRSNIEILK
jgi:hypothetical protein